MIEENRIGNAVVHCCVASNYIKYYPLLVATLISLCRKLCNERISVHVSFVGWSIVLSVVQWVWVLYYPGVISLILKLFNE